MKIYIKIIGLLFIVLTSIVANSLPLKKGMVNLQVKQLQQYLVAQGLKPGTPDGDFGRKTVIAVREFQKNNDLPVTGIVDEATWQSLIQYSNSDTTTKNKTIKKAVISLPDWNEKKPTAETVDEEGEDIVEEDAEDITDEVVDEAVNEVQAEVDVVTQVVNPDDQQVRIAVLAHRGIEWAKSRWEPTANYLTQHISGYHFVIDPLTHEELNQAVAVGSVDFVLTNPGMYVKFEALYKTRRIATLKNLRLGKGITEFGSVLFRDISRDDITSISDLKNKKVAAVNASAFGGWLMSKRLIMESGVDVDDLEMSYTGTHDDVVYAVRDGLADAGVVRTDTLERMAKSNKIKLTDFALIYRNVEYGNRFPFLLSTRLYPEWPFAATFQTPSDLTEKVAITLIGISKNDPVAKAGRYEGWTVPLNYQPVHDILRELRVEPYQDFGKVTLAGVLRQYWHVITLAILLMFGLMAATLYSRRVNSKLTHLNAALTDTQAQLEDELSERKRAEQEVQQTSDALKIKNGELEYSLQQIKEMQNQVNKQEKMASLGRLTAGIAAEMKTPIKLITDVANNSAKNIQALQDKLEEQQENIDPSLFSFFHKALSELHQSGKKMHDSSDRIDSIMRNMLSYTSVESPKSEPVKAKSAKPTGNRVDINKLFEKQANLTLQGMKAKDSSYDNIVLETQFANLPDCDTNDKELAKALVNLVNNACYAVHEKDKQQKAIDDDEYIPTIRLSTAKTASHIELYIWDNGIGIADDIKDKIMQPMFTTKPRGAGAGLGLPMSRDIIAKSLQGELIVGSKLDDYTEATIKLPL